MWLYLVYQRVTDLGHVNELLVCRRTHVETDGQQFLQGGYNQRSLHRVAVSTTLLLGSLNI